MPNNNLTNYNGNLAGNNKNDIEIPTKKQNLISRFLFGDRRLDTFHVVRYKNSVDRIFLIIVIMLVCIGTVTIFSSSYAYADYKLGDSYYYVKKQLLMVIIGFGVMFLMTFKKLNYEFLHKWSNVIFISALILNIITPIIGVVTNGAPRWIELGSLRFQPSEIMKIAIVIFFASYIDKYSDKMKEFKTGILFPFSFIGILGIIMLFQKHFSGLIILAAICIFMIFIGNAPLKWLALIGGIGASGLLFIILGTDYAKARIDAWLEPFENHLDGGWQITQSLMALGSGGLFGVGFGESRQKYLYLPEPQNDYIFAIWCEEMGFIGAIAVIVLFVILIWRGFVIAYNAPDRFSSLVVLGITFKVAIQILLNLGVVTNTIPSTGISLPFISYGGTAFIILLAEMGIILSISRYSYQQKI